MSGKITSSSCASRVRVRPHKYFAAFRVALKQPLYGVRFVHINTTYCVVAASRNTACWALLCNRLKRRNHGKLCSGTSWQHRTPCQLFCSLSGEPTASPKVKTQNYFSAEVGSLRREKNVRLNRDYYILQSPTDCTFPRLRHYRANVIWIASPTSKYLAFNSVKLCWL